MTNHSKKNMRTFRRSEKYLKLSSAIALAAFMADTAHAQQILEEIVVTAQKREQSLSDVNLSITAFSGDDIEALGIADSVGIAQQTPGLSIGTPVGEGNNPALSLRGVGLNDFNDIAESTVSLYVDDVYLGALAGQTFQLFDVERIEVLRGPQGTLFGRNSTGGLVHYVSRKASDDNSGYVSLDVGEESLTELEFTQNIALSESLNGRISLKKRDHDGYVENRTGPDGNEADSFAYRAQLSADLNENWNATLNFHGGDSDTVAPIYQVQATGPGGTDFAGFVDTDNDVFAGESDRNGVLDIETQGASLTIEGQLTDNITLTSITAYEDVEKLHEEDTDSSSIQFVDATFGFDYDQFTQELRLNIESGDHNYTVGAFYYEHDSAGFQDLDITDLVGPGSGVNLDQDSQYAQDLESFAVFGQADWALSDNWDLSVGVRYTDEDKDFFYNNAFDVVVTGFGVVDGAVIADNLQDSTDSSEVTGNVTIGWDASDATSLYASIRRGIKAGGFNTGLGAGSEFGEEELTSYEVGIKTNFGSSTRLNASVFYYDYQDFQALTFNSDIGAGEIVNADDTTVVGGEIELVTYLTENLLFSAGVAYSDNEIDAITDAQGVTLPDRQLVLAPELEANWILRYNVPLASKGDVSFQLDGNYKSDHFFDVSNIDVSRQGGYTVSNARIGWASENKNLELSLWAKNIFEKEYQVYSFDFTGLAGFNQQFFGQPRWIGGSVKYQW